ncbi:MAG: ABC transporter permease [Candidatus Micrarchaeota archaeon]
MKLKYILSLALDNIRHRKLRSWLTILGIIIGVASIVSLISISIGVSDQISERMNTLGSNIIQISAGGQQAQRSGGMSGVRIPTGGFGGSGGGAPDARFGKTSTQSNPIITFREADDLRVVPGVYKLDARLQNRESVSYIDKNTSLTVTGTEPESFKDSVGVEMYDGRYLSTSDQFSVVLGFNVANATFNDLDMLNKQIKIGKIPFRVVGILKQSGGMSGADGSIFIPQETAKDLFNQSEEVSQIIVVVSEDHDTDTVAAAIESKLIELHRVTKDTEDFQITTATSLQSTIASVTEVLGLLLGGIASISLLVGGIGVANTMFMSVLEQTKDIGVLKSIGVKNLDVVLLFLFEAGIIGFVGGLFGVLLSFGTSFALGSFGVPTSLTPALLIGALLFSVVIGVVAGVAPARNAARIPPIEALKYE